MKENYLEKLEFNKIAEILSTFCITHSGKNIALNIEPSNISDKVKQTLAETNEAVSVLYKCGIPPIKEVSDNTEAIKILESYGVLSAKFLLDLANIFKTSEDLKKYFYVDYILDEDFPILNSHFSTLYSNPSIYETIFKSIIDENTISDDASKTLNSIRKKERLLTDDIKSKLNNFIHSAKFSKYIQESVVTIRNDRYVIPVKEEYRNEIKGFIHDISSSGSTIFIEPISIFELNNELSELKAEEAIEIEKILQDLTKLFYPYITELKNDMEQIAYIDFIFAKAKYSKSINGITPKINNQKKIILNNAKHPLLNQSSAVPITLTLGENFNT